MNLKLENKSCPLGCSENDEAVLTGRDLLHNLPGEFSIVKCRACGLMRTNPRPTPDSIGFYYPDNYGPYQVAENTDVGVNNTSKIKPSNLKSRIKHLLGLEARILPLMPPGRLLEIGSASGTYLLQMKQQGWQVEGIEFSASAAQQAQDQGLAVQIATVESAKAPSAPVDIVAAWMVLEHLHDPVAALVKIRDWVKQDGYLVASVPDADSLIRKAFGNLSYDLQLPTHLYHFTPNALNKLLKHCGWQLIRVVWQRNCNTLLWSAEYLAQEKKYRNLEKLIHWLRTAKQAGKFRVLLGWILGVMRLSGRIEIWAQPISNNGQPLP
ncbi:MAG: class I SAM-dependent methyltransferase [Methylococcales bacterium]|nr:class I SAM-dependent methyltransferase [Methylococcales bacterium]